MRAHLQGELLGEEEVDGRGDANQKEGTMRRVSLFACLSAAILLQSQYAQAESLWTWAQGAMGLNTPATPEVTPSAILHGQLPAPGMMGEVAVSQSVIQTGECVPLPAYADGTSAGEEEVFWTATLWRAQFPSGWCRIWPWLIDGDRCDIEFAGRTLTSTYAIVDNADIWCVSGKSGWDTRNVQVLVTVVAVRYMPTQAQRRSWSSVKGSYR